MGSLRWWAEALLRGHEPFFVCDPAISDQRCPSKEKRDGKQIYCYCAACLLFGATGLRRSFSIQLSGGKVNNDVKRLRIVPENRSRGWYLNSGIYGNLKMRIIPYKDSFNPEFVLLPLAIAAHWGGIGAKTQHGYGVVELFDSSLTGAASILGRWEKLRSSLPLNYGMRKDKNDLVLPNLKDMFFAKVRFSPKNDWWKEVDGLKGDSNVIDWVKAGSVPIAPVIRNWLRYGKGKKLWQSDKVNKESDKVSKVGKIEKCLFGSSKNNRTAAKINISSAYPLDNGQWEFRLWGWIPKEEKIISGIRENFLNELKESLAGQKGETNPYSVLEDSLTRPDAIIWREFASDRDTVTGSNSDYFKYVDSLAQGEEGRP